MSLKMRQFAIYIAFFCASASAQVRDRSISTPSDQIGIPGYASFSVDSETINLINGNLNFVLPLVRLPGRAGHDVKLSIAFNTKQYSPYLFEVPFNPVNQNPAIGGFAGWKPDELATILNYPRLIKDYNVAGQASNGTDAEGIATYSDLYCDFNYVHYDEAGTKHSFYNKANCKVVDPRPEFDVPISDAGDGSMLRLDTSNVNDIVLYRPDGSQVHFYDSETKDIDRNGNVITYLFHSDGSMSIYDTLNRQIDVSPIVTTYVLDADGNPTFGTTLSSSVKWRDEAGQDQTVSLSGVAIDLPASVSATCPNYFTHQPETNWQTGHFGYRYTFTWSGSHPKTYVLTLNGLGELTRVDLPSGGYLRYEYADTQAAQHIRGNYVSIDCTSVSHRQVSAKYVCSSTTGSCSSESTTTFTPTVMVGGEGQNQSMDVRNSDGRKHHVFQTFAGFSNATVEVESTTYQNENTPLSKVETEFYTASTDATAVNPQKKKVTAITYNGGQESGRSDTTFEYSTRMYKCPFFGVDIIYGCSSTDGPVLQTPRISRQKQYDLDGALLSDTQYTLGSYESGGVYNWDLTGSVKTTGKYGDIVRTDYEYDVYREPLAITNAVQHNSVSSSRGNVTAITRHVDGEANPLSSYSSFDDTGNVIKSTDARGNATTFQYNDVWSANSCSTSATSTFAYVTQVEDPLHHISQNKYNYCTGTLLESRDQNSHWTTMSYDQYGRPSRVDRPDGGWTTMERSDTAPAYQTETTSMTSGGQTLVKSVDFDGLGRMSASHLNEGSGAQITTDYAYDGVGRTQRVSVPYEGATDTSKPGTTFEYDALSRKTKEHTPGGTSFKEWKYSGNSVDYFDEGLVKHTYAYDALNRLKTVKEYVPEASATLTTTYDYNVNGDLLSVVQGGTGSEAPRSRTFAYDSLSRLVSADNPETGLVCYGTLSSGTCQKDGYDGNGNLVTKIDKRGVTTGFSYDADNRLVMKKFTGESGRHTPTRCYLYDSDSDSSSTGNTIGRLVSEWTQTGDCSSTTGVPTGSAISWKNALTYNPVGNLLSEHQCILRPCPSTNPISYTYDLVGNVTTSSNGMPASSSPGIISTYQYDAANRLKKVFTTWDDPNPATLLFKADDAGSYGPFGLLNAKYGVNPTTTIAALAESRTYDVRGRLMTKIVTGSNASPQPATGSITISPNPAAVGVTVMASNICGEPCGSGYLMMFVDDVYMQGGGYTPQTTQTFFVDTTGMSLGTHYVKITYGGDATHPSLSTDNTPFTVQANSLPSPTISIALDRTLYEGEAAFATVTLTGCGANCGLGVVLTDGGAPSGLQFDQNGQAEGRVPGLSTGPHTITAKYYGNGTFSSAQMPLPVNVLENTLPYLAMTPSFSPDPIPQGEFSWLTVNSNCGSACGNSHIFIDNQYYGGFLFGSDGNFQGYVDTTGLGVGPHTLKIQYYGSSYFRTTTSGDVTFHVEENLLPVPTLTIDAPLTRPAGPLGSVVIHSSCGTNCGSPTWGHIFWDGNYAGTFDLDSSGNATFYSNSSATPGTHQLTAKFYGNTTWAPATAPVVDVHVTN